MIPQLNDIIGLPLAASAAELGHASEKHFQRVYERASLGGIEAQRELITLRVAYLNWAYGSRYASQGDHCLETSHTSGYYFEAEAVRRDALSM